MNIIVVIPDEGERARAEAHLETLRDLCRIPSDAQSIIFTQDSGNESALV